MWENIKFPADGDGIHPRSLGKAAGIHHDEWLILQRFYNGLTTTSRANIDAAAGGAFLDLTIAKAKELVEKMVSNQGWSDERFQPRIKGTHTVKKTDMIVAKLDLLLKHLGKRAEFKKHRENYARAMELYFTCEVCGNDGHSGNDYPETREDCAYLNNNNNNGYRPQQGAQGWN